MRTWFYILPLIFFSENFFSQETFLKTFYENTQYYSSSFYQIEETEDGYVVLGGHYAWGYNPLTEIFASDIIKVDFKGGIVWDNWYSNNTCGNRINSFTLSKKQDIVGVGSSVSEGDTCQIFPDIQPIIEPRYQTISIQSNGSLNWRKYFGQQYPFYTEIAQSILPMNNDCFMVGGQNGNNPYFFKMNINGDTLWSKKYNPLLSGVTDMVQTPDSTYISIVQSVLTDDYVMCIDIDGNILWTNTFGYTRYSDIEKTDDGQYVILGQESIAEDNAILFSINKNGNLNWEQIYPIRAYKALEIFDNDNYLIGYNDFAKVNKSGEILWNRIYIEPDTTINAFFPYQIWDIKTTSDGGIILGGNIGTGIDLLIKTDCEGNLEWDTKSCLIPSIQDVLVFPNPTQGELTIHLPNLTKDAKISFKLFDLSGKIVKEVATENKKIIVIDVRELSQGMYLYQLILNGKEYRTGKIIKAE